MQWVVLTTDALFFGLLLVAAAYVVYAARHEHLRAPWREVLRNPMAMGASVVLACYLSVGLLDSIHFTPRLDDGEDGTARYGTEIISLFDWLVGPLRSQVEKTYSAPFALNAFSKETIELPGGGTTRDYPRLLYAGAHLDGPDQRAADIALRATVGALVGLLLLALITVAVAALRRQPLGRSLREIGAGSTDVPWRVILGTVGVILVLGCALAALASNYHVLGTDKVGVDVLYQALKSIRTGLMIGTLTTLVMLPFALLLGIAAGYFRGLVDDAIQYLYTTLSSIPGVLLIASAALILEVYMARNGDAFDSLAARADLRLLALCVILGVTSWTGLCRLLRGEALKLREIEYIEAARAFGVSHATIIARHLVPNVMHIVMISIVLDFSGLVLAEAVLSYINIGVDPSMESWGNMINSARLELARDPVVWWSLLAAFVFMFVLVLAANVFADAVRDAFDPRLRKLRR